MIYYGDEVGMWGGNDPDSRKPMIWDDIDYEAEEYNPDGSLHQPDTVEVNKSLFQHYKKLIAIRNNHPALQLGTYKTLFTADKKGILIFERKYEDEKIIVVINNGDNKYVVDIPELRKKCTTDLLNKNVFDGSEITIAKKWGLILKECL